MTDLLTKFKGMYPESYLLEYITKIKMGDILTGMELKQILDNLLRDLNNEKYRFELSEPHKRIKFIESLCRHSISPWAGKPFLLELWQKSIIEAIYGIRMFDDETGEWIRRFTEILLIVGRKNGKSSFCSALGLCEFFCGPTGVNVLCASNDLDQSSILFDEINNMREESKALDRVTRKNIKGIFMGNPKQKKNSGKFSYRNKAKIRKLSANTGAKEGRNLDFSIIDEVHEMKDSSLIMPVKQSMSTKLEPLMIQITTEGFTNEGYLDMRLKEARQVLNGELDRPRWLIWLYTQDSEREIWQDEKTWVKSNPGLGTIKKWSFLRQMVEEARTNKETRVFVLAKDFNIKQNQATAWLSENEYTNEETFDIEDFRGCKGLGAVDLSETTDLTCAKMLLMRQGDPKKYVITKYFIPESKIEKGELEDKKNYRKWVNDNLIQVSPGNENDFSQITAWFVHLYRQYNIYPYKVGYDNALAKYWVKEMEELGFDMERVNQDKYTMSNPMKLVADDFRSGLINYGNNPVDRWCLGNTAFKFDTTGNYIMPVKINDLKNRRIDGAVTLIIAYAIYVRYRAEYLNIVR